MRISDWSSDVCSSDLRADVVRAAVLVLQVVGVLPHVQAQDRGVARADALHERAVQVGAALDRELAGLVHAKPRPAAAEAGKIGRASCRERECQFVYISVGAVAIKKKKNTTVSFII